MSRSSDKVDKVLKTEVYAEAGVAPAVGACDLDCNIDVPAAAEVRVETPGADLDVRFEHIAQVHRGVPHATECERGTLETDASGVKGHLARGLAAAKAQAVFLVRLGGFYVCATNAQSCGNADPKFAAARGQSLTGQPLAFSCPARVKTHAVVAR
jgi:hypothetical protein